MAIRDKGKLRNLGIVFKTSFKCFKNEKIIFILMILKLECLFYQNICIYVPTKHGICTIMEFFPPII